MSHLLASEEVIYRSPDPANLYCYTPWLADGFQRRLLLSFDVAGPGLSQVPGPKSDHGDCGSNQLEIYVSDDRGKRWRHTARLPMLHARIFKAGSALYVLGHSGRLLISRSNDNGETWSEPSVLEADHYWHQSGGSIDYRHGKIYLSMEHAPYPDRWAGGDPILMSAAETADLTKPEAWTFSNKLRFAEDVPHLPNPCGLQPSCWLESSVVRLYDPNGTFYDPDDRTVLLFLRLAGTQMNDYAGLIKGVESPDGKLQLEWIRQSDGTPLLYVPFPGGYMKFQVLYDERSRRYWLITSQPDHSSLARNPIPFGERRRLELFYSSNLFDWCSAGLVAVGSSDHCSRHYASLLADDDDLLVLSRSGDEEAKNEHDTDLITLHRIRNFRQLAI